MEIPPSRHAQKKPSTLCVPTPKDYQHLPRPLSSCQPVGQVEFDPKRDVDAVLKQGGKVRSILDGSQDPVYKEVGRSSSNSNAPSKE